MSKDLSPTHTTPPGLQELLHPLERAKRNPLLGTSKLGIGGSLMPNRAGCCILILLFNMYLKKVGIATCCSYQHLPTKRGAQHIGGERGACGVSARSAQPQWVHLWGAAAAPRCSSQRFAGARSAEGINSGSSICGYVPGGTYV